MDMEYVIGVVVEFIECYCKVGYINGCLVYVVCCVVIGIEIECLCYGVLGNIYFSEI